MLLALVGAGAPGVVVVDGNGVLVTVLPASQVLGLVLPGYLRGQPGLARTWDEAHADRFASVTQARTVREGLPGRIPAPLSVDPDDTVIEIALSMVDAHAPLVVVVEAGRPVGAISVRHLINDSAVGLRASMTGWFAVAVFAAVYVLLATERVHRVAAALGGAAVVLVTGVMTTDDAFFSRETGVAWDVLALLLAMMVIVGVLRPTGVFEFLAIWAVKRGRGRPYPVLVLLLLVTAITSAFLDNVTTVVLIAPVTLLVCERIGLRAAPVLVAEVLASNIGGAATLVGDPPNIIIASRADLSFNDFLVHMAPIIIVILVVYLLAARWLFRAALAGSTGAAEAVEDLDERAAIQDATLLRRSLLVLALVIVGFVAHGALHTEPAVVAMGGAALLVLISRAPPSTYLEAVEWETLAFFAGIFIVIGALVKAGVIDSLADKVISRTGGNVAATLVVVLVASAVISAFVDNIPYVVAMTPLVAQLVIETPALGVDGGVWWALALGADLGGNATAVGASANIVVIGLARQYGHPISFWEFARYGIPVAMGSILISLPYVLLRYA